MRTCILYTYTYTSQIYPYPRISIPYKTSKRPYDLGSFFKLTHHTPHTPLYTFTHEHISCGLLGLLRTFVRYRHRAHNIYAYIHRAYSISDIIIFHHTKLLAHWIYIYMRCGGGQSQFIIHLPSQAKQHTTRNGALPFTDSVAHPLIQRPRPRSTRQSVAKDSRQALCADYIRFV